VLVTNQAGINYIYHRRINRNAFLATSFHDIKTKKAKYSSRKTKSPLCLGRIHMDISVK
jgi:hypothetical protein